MCFTARSSAETAIVNLVSEKIKRNSADLYICIYIYISGGSGPNWPEPPGRPLEDYHRDGFKPLLWRWGHTSANAGRPRAMVEVAGFGILEFVHRPEQIHCINFRGGNPDFFRAR